MEVAFKQGNYEDGAIRGIREVTRHLTQHYPAAGARQNELPDQPVVL
jgi:uncharacterized membrane protein